MHALITDNAHRRLNEPFESVAAALRRLEPTQPLRDALASLGLSHLVSVQVTDVPATRSSAGASFGLTWQLADHVRAHVAWSLAVTPLDDHDSLLSADVRAGTDSPAAGQQLLAAWPLLGRIVSWHTTRLLDAIRELAEQISESSPELALPQLTAAA